MQETRKMDLKQLEDLMKYTDSGLVEQKKTLISDHIQNNQPLDSASALQAFLNHIPISSIPGIKNSPELQVLELKTGKSVREAIELLYEKIVSGALIADVPDLDTTIGRYSDRYIGFTDLASMILWSPEIGELAKSFLWDPFFPVCLDDTLFHALLLISKHPLNIVPVIEQPDSQIMGFITQNVVIQRLLQSNGLDWFDGIADKALSEFRFENADHVVQVYGDQSIAEAVKALCRNRVGIIAVMDRGTKRLIGTMRRGDIHLLLENEDLYHNRETLTMEEFIHRDASKTDSNPTIERDIGTLLSAGVLRLRNSYLPRMDQPITNKKTDSLKQAMKNLAETKSGFSFSVEDSQKATGVLTIREVIIQFAPPCLDTAFHGGGFFESVLEQTGCKIENGTMVCDH